MSFVWGAASQRYLDLGELRAKEVGTRKWMVGARFPRLPIDAKGDRATRVFPLCCPSQLIREEKKMRLQGKQTMA